MTPFFGKTLLVLAATATLLPGVACAQTLRERFPASSIDSAAKAEAALAATNGAKVRVEAEYKTTARECLKKFLVNDCVDDARDVRRRRLADIDAVTVEANRFKRRDRDDRIETERKRREDERVANEKADGEQRARNRQAYADRQEQARREAADRAKSDAARAARPPGAHRPVVKVGPPGSAEAKAAQRAKNAADQAEKVKEAASHRDEMKRRADQKAADRAQRAKDKAAKEAREAKAAAPRP